MRITLLRTLSFEIKIKNQIFDLAWNLAIYFMIFLYIILISFLFLKLNYKYESDGSVLRTCAKLNK